MASESFLLGDNIVGQFQGEHNEILTLAIDLTTRLRPSTSGKSVLVATTGGAKDLPGQRIRTSVGINIYVQAEIPAPAPIMPTQAAAPAVKDTWAKLGKDAEVKP